MDDYGDRVDADGYAAEGRRLRCGRALGGRIASCRRLGIHRCSGGRCARRRDRSRIASDQRRAGLGGIGQKRAGAERTTAVAHACLAQRAAAATDIDQHAGVSLREGRAEFLQHGMHAGRACDLHHNRSRRGDFALFARGRQRQREDYAEKQ